MSTNLTLSRAKCAQKNCNMLAKFKVNLWGNETTHTLCEDCTIRKTLKPADIHIYGVGSRYDCWFCLKRLVNPERKILLCSICLKEKSNKRGNADIEDIPKDQPKDQSKDRMNSRQDINYAS